MWGHDDPVLPLKAMRAFTNTISNSQGYVVTLGGHTPMMQAPDEFNCAVDKFLDDQPLDGCKQFALTKQTREARLAGREWGPHYAGPLGQ